MSTKLSSKPKTILIVDADLVAYRHAAAAETRSIIAKHLKSGDEKEFPNRTEFQEYLKRIDYQYDPDNFLITDVQTPEEIQFALASIKRNIEKMLEFTWADDLEVYLGSGQTFRHRLPLPTPYKNNRGGSLRPVHLEKCREYLTKKYNGKHVSEIETDDIVTIRAYDHLGAGNKPIIATVDKDAYQSQGVTLLNWMEDEWRLHLVPDVGHLRKEKSAIKGDGLMFLAYQTLAGDNSDTYCGYQLSEVKYGPTAAMNALKNATSESDIMIILQEQFQKLYPEEFTYADHTGKLHTADWESMLNLYWKCAYMKRYDDDQSEIKEFRNRRGI